MILEEDPQVSDPAGDDKVIVCARVSRAGYRHIEAIRAAEGRSRSEMVRQLLKEAVEARLNTRRGAA